MVIFIVIYASFIQCLIDRYPNYFINKYSFCFSCNQKLKIYDNIPIISYFLLKGRCRNCKTKISKLIIVTEILFSVMYVFITYLKYDITLFFIFSMLYMASVVDIKTGEIPDLSWIIISILSFQNPKFELIIYILIIGGILSFFKLIGFGDIKLLASLSLHLNFYNFILGLFLSCILALSKAKKGTIKFAPYIGISYFIIFLLQGFQNKMYFPFLNH